MLWGTEADVRTVVFLSGKESLILNKMSKPVFMEIYRKNISKFRLPGMAEVNWAVLLPHFKRCCKTEKLIKSKKTRLKRWFSIPINYSSTAIFRALKTNFVQS